MNTVRAIFVLVGVQLTLSHIVPVIPNGNISSQSLESNLPEQPSARTPANKRTGLCYLWPACLSLIERHPSTIGPRLNPIETYSCPICQNMLARNLPMSPTSNRMPLTVSSQSPVCPFCSNNRVTQNLQGQFRQSPQNLFWQNHLTTNQLVSPPLNQMTTLTGTYQPRACQFCQNNKASRNLQNQLPEKAANCVFWLNSLPTSLPTPAPVNQKSISTLTNKPRIYPLLQNNIILTRNMPNLMPEETPSLIWQNSLATNLPYVNKKSGYPLHKNNISIKNTQVNLPGNAQNYLFSQNLLGKNPSSMNPRVLQNWLPTLVPNYNFPQNSLARNLPTFPSVNHKLILTDQPIYRLPFSQDIRAITNLPGYLPENAPNYLFSLNSLVKNPSPSPYFNEISTLTHTNQPRSPLFHNDKDTRNFQGHFPNTSNYLLAKFISPQSTSATIFE